MIRKCEFEVSKESEETHSLALPEAVSLSDDLDVEGHKVPKNQKDSTTFGIKTIKARKKKASYQPAVRKSVRLSSKR